MSSNLHKSPPAQVSLHDSSEVLGGAASPMDLVGDEILLEMFRMLGSGHFRMVAGTCRRFRRVYTHVDPSCTTSAKEIVCSVTGASFFCSDAMPTTRFQIRLPKTRWQEGFEYPTRILPNAAEFVRSMAAAHGRVETLEWLQHQEACQFQNPWLFILAAMNNHLNVIQWLCDRKHRWTKETCTFAASNGHLGVLQWVTANGCPWTERVCALAALNGHLEVLKWAISHGCPPGTDICEYAAINGHLDVLEWARAHGQPWNTKTCAAAAQYGHLNVLTWCRANGCPWDYETCSGAASNGHLRVLQWARSNGCPWNELTCSLAAGNGHLTVLQWARAHGCPWNKQTCAFAASSGHLEVLDWARTNGCPEW